MHRLRLRKVILAASVVVLGFVVARFVFAGHTTAVLSYTGCLNLNSGTFSSVAPGEYDYRLVGRPRFRCISAAATSPASSPEAG
jgi:hypothetical protein